jgi:arylsulfatase A-like enzyme
VSPWIPLLALAGAAVAEGAVVAWKLMAAGAAEGGHVVLSSLTGAAVVLVLGVPCVVLALMASRLRGVVQLGRALRDGLGGGGAGRPGQPALALLVVGLAVAAVAWSGFVMGDPLIAAMSRRFAGLALAVAGLTVAVAVLVLGAAVAPALASLCRRAVNGMPRWVSAAGAVALAIVVLVGIVGALRAFLPWPYALMPAGAVGGGLVATSVAHRWPFPHRLAGAIVLVLWAAAAGVLFALPGFPSEVRGAVLYRAPYASLGLAAAEPLLDRMGSRGTPREAMETGAAATPWEPPAERAFDWPDTIARPQNLVLIQVDALRPDHLGFTGYRRPTSPRLDRFREGATWWKNAYTPAPSTRFAMAALFTGLDPRRAPHRSLGGNRFRLLPQARTVAEVLDPLGYRRHGLTISYVKHHNLGLGQGFEQWKTPWPVDDWQRIYGKAADITSSAAIRWLDAQPSGTAPYLLFLHYRCTHDPYIKHAQWDFGDSEVDRYDSALAYCDQEIGRVLDELEGREDYGRTTIVLFSDHGELFGEHGHTRHGNTLYEPDVRIALLTRIPGVSRRTVESPVLLTDVAPTLLALAGADPAPDMDGRSLLPLAVGEPAPKDTRPLFMFTDLWRGTVRYQASAVLQWPLKLIRDERLGVVELYDVVSDPEERMDLSRPRAQDAARLSRLLDGYGAYLEQAGTYPR